MNDTIKFQNEYVETKELYFERHGVMSEKSLHIDTICWLVLALSSLVFENIGFAILFFAIVLLQSSENNANKEKYQKEYDQMWEEFGKDRSFKTDVFDDRIELRVGDENTKVYNCDNVLGFIEGENLLRIYFLKEESKKLNKKGKVKAGNLKDSDMEIVCVKKDAFVVGELDEFKKFLKEKQCVKVFVLD